MLDSFRVLYPVLVTNKGKRRRYAEGGTKMIPSLRNLSYEEGLKRLGMFPLRRRRLRGEVFKMIHGIDEVNLGNVFVQERNFESQNSRKLKHRNEVFH